jgi:hypothetical protein
MNNKPRTLENFINFAKKANSLNTLERALANSNLSLMDQNKVRRVRRNNRNLFNKNQKAAMAKHLQGLAQRNRKEKMLQNERNAKMRAYHATPPPSWFKRLFARRR